MKNSENIQNIVLQKGTIIATLPMIIRCRQRLHWSMTLGVGSPYFCPGLGLAFCGLGLGLEAYGLVNITAY